MEHVAPQLRQFHPRHTQHNPWQQSVSTNCSDLIDVPTSALGQMTGPAEEMGMWNTSEEMLSRGQSGFRG